MTYLDRNFLTWYLDILGPITPIENLAKSRQKKPQSVVPAARVSPDLWSVWGCVLEGSSVDLSAFLAGQGLLPDETGTSL